MTINVYLPIHYLLTFIVGPPSNLLPLWVLLFQTKLLPSTMLLINLTLAVCLVLLALPFQIVYHFHGNHWELGEPLCHAVMAVFHGNMHGSVCVFSLWWHWIDTLMWFIHLGLRCFAADGPLYT